ncbi:MAG: hypothetical protein ACRDHY_00275 [Anaerolineales bacterium]
MGPNFYRLEHDVANVPWHDRCLDRPLDLRGDQLHLSPRPGLGVEVDPPFLRTRPPGARAGRFVPRSFGLAILPGGVPAHE